MAMIFERTMMFGLTLRNDIPISSRSPTLALDITACIQRVKYFATSRNRTSRTIRTITQTTIRAISRGGRAAWASKRRFIGILSRSATHRTRPGEVGRIESCQQFVEHLILGLADDDLAASGLHSADQGT